MLRMVVLSTLLVAGATMQLYAGDTVTLNMPGGASQSVFSGVIGGAITGYGGGVLPIGGGQVGVFTSVQQDPVTGITTFTTGGGQSFGVTSGFISSILGYYQ